MLKYVHVHLCATLSLTPNSPGMETDASQQTIQDMATLNLLARQRGFIVRDVSCDGNCLFTAVETQVQKCGTQCGDQTLREQLVTYLKHWRVQVNCLGWPRRSSRTSWYAPCWYPHHLNNKPWHGAYQNLTAHPHWSCLPWSNCPISLPDFGEDCPPPYFGSHQRLPTDFWRQQSWRWSSSLNRRLRERRRRSI